MWSEVVTYVLCSVLRILRSHAHPSCSHNHKDQRTGGATVDSATIPWQASLIIDKSLYKTIFGRDVNNSKILKSLKYVKRTTGFCGASLVTDRYLISVAHCFKHYNGDITWIAQKVDVKLGGTNRNPDGSELGAVFKTHSSWDPYTLQVPKSNDISIIQLEKAVSFTDKISPINLPAHATPVGTKAYVGGYGKFKANRISDGQLRLKEVTVISNEECSRYLSLKMKSSFLCTTSDKVSGCKGDSGGPLFTITRQKDGRIATENILIGVISRGWDNCLGPVVHTRTSAFLPYLRANIPDLNISNFKEKGPKEIDVNLN